MSTMTIHAHTMENGRSYRLGTQALQWQRAPVAIIIRPPESHEALTVPPADLVAWVSMIERALHTPAHEAMVNLAIGARKFHHTARVRDGQLVVAQETPDDDLPTVEITCDCELWRLTAAELHACHRGTPLSALGQW